MDYAAFRNTMREWMRTKVGAVPELAGLDLVVPNEVATKGLNSNYLRYSLQMGEASVVGVGTEIKRRRRLGRVYIEVFGEVGQGEGLVSSQANLLEEILREAGETRTRIHNDIVVFEPSTFERPEGGRYCQVVNSRVQLDHFS